MTTPSHPLPLRKIGMFLGITFAINWLMILIFWLAGGEWKGTNAVFMGILYMIVPMSVAYILSHNIFREEFTKEFGIPVKFGSWYAFAWLVFPLLTVVVFGIELLIPGVEFAAKLEGILIRLSQQLPPDEFKKIQEAIQNAPAATIILPVIQGLLVGPTLNALIAFGEEMGWRGFLYHHTRSLGFWKASFFIGAVWGTWHAPIILMGHNYPMHPIPGVFMMIAWTILLSPLFQFIRRKSGSVVAAAVAHGSLNASAGFPLFLIKGGNDLTVGVTGLAGFIALVIANLLLFVYLLKNPVEMSFPEE